MNPVGLICITIDLFITRGFVVFYFGVLEGNVEMGGSKKDNIIIGLMIIFTYFLVYTYLGNSRILQSIGGLPLIQSVPKLTEKGFSSEHMSELTKDFAQLIIVVYVVLFIRNILPWKSSLSIGTAVSAIIQYTVLFITGIWVTRSLIFSERMNEILKMFVAVFSVVCAGIGTVFMSPIRRVITQNMATEYLKKYVLNSRMVQWLADSFVISAAILFLIIAIEMTVGISSFLAVILTGVPSIISLVVTLLLLYIMIKI